MTTDQTAEVEVAESLPSLVSRRVRGFMAENRLKQGEVALQLGMSRTAFNDRVNDVKPFNLAELPALASVLGTTMEYLLGLTDDRSPRQAAAAAPGGGSLFVAADEAGGTPSRTRTANPLIKDSGQVDGAAVLPFPCRPVANAPAVARVADVIELHRRSA